MLSTLRRIVLEFNQEAELQIALTLLVSQVKQAMNTDCCSVYLADYQSQQFLLTATDGLAQASLGRTKVGFSEGVIGLVGQREEPINIANAHLHPHFKQAPEVEEEALKAFLGTPIIHQSKVLGIISVQQKAVRNFDENEEAFLVTLAAQLAGAIASAEARGMLVTTKSNGKWGKHLVGIPGAPGLALSEVIICQPDADLSSISLVKSIHSETQKHRFYQAVLKTRADFQQMGEQLSTILSDDNLDIFEMYKQLLSNASLADEINAKITKGWTAESALKQIIDGYVVQFEGLDDVYIRERASDIRDLGNRLLFNLQQQKKQSQTLPETFILVAEEVTAAMLVQYQHKGLQAIVSLSGSNNSHAAILARALAIPAIMGIDPIPLNQLEQQTVIVDGYSGELFIAPNESLKSEYKHLINEEAELTEKVRTVVDLPTITQDGKTIELLLNAGLASGFKHSMHAGATGIGLYRTEIPFLERHSFPTEQEQTALYAQVLKAFPDQQVTMRTLDVGGDKALSYFPINEENPFLGWRGIRITLDHPEIFLVQIRAMIRAAIEFENLEIMLPMIASVSEVDDAINLINQAYYELTAELSEKIPRPKIGIMLEVPGVIFQLKELASRVDFFSVGSNDLTQYLLAVDRNNSRVANLYDAYHPAVLRALNIIAQESNKYLIPLSLCGELAGDPAGAILLLAMGYDKLSMNPHNIARIKWVIRHINYQQTKLILAEVLAFTTAKQVHSYLNEQLEMLGLGGFVRAGM
jgi:phosphotransferase system, enzyme I, PtsP